MNSIHVNVNPHFKQNGSLIDSLKVTPGENKVQKLDQIVQENIENVQKQFDAYHRQLQEK